MTCCRRIKTNLSFDGDAETIDGSLGAVSLTKDVSIVKLMQTSVRSHSSVIGHFNPLDFVTVELEQGGRDAVYRRWRPAAALLADNQFGRCVCSHRPERFLFREQKQKKRNLKLNRLEHEKNVIFYLHDRGRYKVILLQCRWLNGRYQWLRHFRLFWSEWWNCPWPPWAWKRHDNTIGQFVALQNTMQFIECHNPFGFFAFRVGQHQQMVAQTGWIHHWSAHLQTEI